MIPMSQHDHEKCYGTMFPSILPAEADRLVSGKVFSYELRRAGGTFVSHRKVAANMQEWDNCLACPNLSTATNSAPDDWPWRQLLQAESPTSHGKHYSGKTKADTTDCFDQSAQVTQFLAKSDDLNIDRPQGYGVVRSLNSVDDLPAGTNNPRMACEETQQQKLGLGQCDRLARDGNLPSRRINDDPVSLDYGLVFEHGG